MIILEKIEAFGHENIRCSHSSTIEITKDTFLTAKGTCILGINATKACFDLSPKVKEKIQNGNRFNIIIKVDNLIETFYGSGHKDLTLFSKKDMVFRKSDFICDRTVLINCSKASFDLNRNLIEKINTSDKKFSIIFCEPDSNERDS